MTRTKGTPVQRRRRPAKGGTNTTTTTRMPAGDRRSKRPGARRKDIRVGFEHLGEDYDDVVVTLKYDKRAVAAIRALPSWARRWDESLKVWRIHPGHAGRLADSLRDRGYSVPSRGPSTARSGQRSTGRAADGSEAPYEATCACCRKQIKKGEPAHWVDGLMLHARCRRPDPRFGVEIIKPLDERPCADCFLIHKGECW